MATTSSKKFSLHYLEHQAPIERFCYYQGARAIKDSVLLYIDANSFDSGKIIIRPTYGAVRSFVKNYTAKATQKQGPVKVSKAKNFNSERENENQARLAFAQTKILNISISFERDFPLSSYNNADFVDRDLIESYFNQIIDELYSDFSELATRTGAPRSTVYGPSRDNVIDVHQTLLATYSEKEKKVILPTIENPATEDQDDGQISMLF